MSIHEAVRASLKKLTDKGDGKITGHRVEVVDDGGFIHTISRKGKRSKEHEYPMTENEKHIHSSVGKLASCIRECHSGVVED